MFNDNMSQEIFGTYNISDVTNDANMILANAMKINAFQRKRKIHVFQRNVDAHNHHFEGT